MQISRGPHAQFIVPGESGCAIARRHRENSFKDSFRALNSLVGNLVCTNRPSRDCDLGFYKRKAGLCTLIFPGVKTVRSLAQLHGCKSAWDTREPESVPAAPPHFPAKLFSVHKPAFRRARTGVLRKRGPFVYTIRTRGRALGFQANRGRERRTRPTLDQGSERETRPRSTRGADGKRVLVHLRGPLL